ncbi:MAG TPA: hypothetical protein VF711_09425 [Acidimicrobiales bacterium]|jgi:hypothetical protein
MNAASVVAAIARRWAATYTFGLPAETRDRRREEIAADLWEQQHDDEDDHGRHRQQPVSLPASVLACQLTSCGEQKNDDPSGGSKWPTLR